MLINNKRHTNSAVSTSFRTGFGLLTGSLLLCASPIGAHAKLPVAGPIQLTSQIVMPAGTPSGSTEILKVPAGFHLVVQTVSYYRLSAIAGSIGNLFVQTEFNKNIGYVAAPEAVADGSAFPSATVTATFYCSAGTAVVINAYRSGSTSAGETAAVTMSGYYVAD